MTLVAVGPLLLEWERMVKSTWHITMPKVLFQDITLFSSTSWPGSLYIYITTTITSRYHAHRLQSHLNYKMIWNKTFFCNDDAGWGWGQPSSDCSESGFSSFMTCPLPPMSELTSRFNSTLKIIPRKPFMMILCYCPLPPMSELTSRFNSTLNIIPRKSFMMIICYCPFPPMLTSRSRRW